VYPAIAISVVPGLSFVQKWRMRSPAAMPEGMLRAAPGSSEVPTLVFVEARLG
jgi:hypothetical protein